MISYRLILQPIYFDISKFFIPLIETPAISQPIAGHVRHQYSNMTPRLSGQNYNLFRLLLPLNFKERLGCKENKYRRLSCKPWSHVRMLIYRTWAINNPQPSWYFFDSCFNLKVVLYI